MEVRNEAESVVGKEVRRREELRAGRGPSSLRGIQSWFSAGGDEAQAACTCRWCATDALAFALTRVPPCYSRSQNFGLAAQWVDPNRVRTAVEAAIEKVSRRPRHSPRVRPRETASLRLIDFGLEAGEQMLEPLLRAQPGLCLCLDCREDTLAYALNRVAPKYGVEMQGNRRMPPHLMEFVRHDLAESIVKAARVIAANPRH